MWGQAHFRSWLSQFVELKGEENVRSEETDSTGFQCYEESGGKIYRIWVRDTVPDNKENELPWGLLSELSNLTISY